MNENQNILIGRKFTVCRYTIYNYFYFKKTNWPEMICEEETTGTLLGVYPVGESLTALLELDDGQIATANVLFLSPINNEAPKEEATTD